MSRLRPLALTACLLAALAAVAAIAAITAVGCGGKSPEAPVARLRLEPSTVRLGYPEHAELVATWEPSVPLTEAAGPPVVFVHLRGAQGGVERTFDHAYPAAWRIGASESYAVGLWQSALGPPLAPGRYELSLGLYDPSSRRRWALDVAGREIDDGEYAVATVEVPPAPATAPAVAFTGNWLPIEPTGDRQTFANRWLAGSGALELAGLAGPTTLAMTLELPDLQDADHRLVLDDGAEAPEVTVDSNCSAAARRLTTFGRQEVELTLVPPADGGACTVRLAPDFVFLHLVDFSRRSVKLERLTWNRVGAQ